MAGKKGVRPPRAGTVSRKGRPNKITRAAKEAFEHAFEGLGGVGGLITWAKRNRTEFYKLYARLIPANLKVSLPPAPLPEGPVVTVEQAAELYRRYVGDSTLDVAKVTFAPSAAPAPRAAVIRPEIAPAATPPTDATFTDVPAPTDTTVNADSPDNVVDLQARLKIWERCGGGS